MAKHLLQQLAEDAGLSTRDYSGRCMYGASCLGVEGDDTVSIFAALFQAVADNEPMFEEIQEIADALKNTRSDSMGLGVILYWPSVKFDGKEKEDEDS